jgi:acetoin utilization deacetylase AcuC-like enzyme
VTIATGFICHPDYLEHDTGPGHVESPERLRAILARLRESGLADRLVELTARPAAVEDILRVHIEKYIDVVRGVAARGGGPLDPDTMVCDQSYDIALLAAGGVMAACDAVMDGTVENAFCAVRPPGHHALSFKAMGFCIFNNVAVAAKYLQAHHEIGRVAIVDWDVHHGNGTQDTFYDDTTVFYASIHQSPHFPGSGHDWEIGKDDAEGTVLNVPVRPGTTNDEFVGALSSTILPAVKEFNPDFLILSAGFDACEEDMLSSQHVTTQGYADMTKMAMDCARECCKSRLVSVLEGGYHLRSLADSVEAHVRTLMNEDPGS